MKHLRISIASLIIASPLLLVVGLRVIRQDVSGREFADVTMYTTAILLAISIYSCVTAYNESKLDNISSPIVRWVTGISVSLTLLVFTMFLRAL